MIIFCKRFALGPVEKIFTEIDFNLKHKNSIWRLNPLPLPPMHAQNPYAERYDLKSLANAHPPLQEHIVLNPSCQQTIDFTISDAVYELNKAMLLADYKLGDYNLPKGYLIPPIPGRLEYLLHLRDFISEKFKVDKAVELRGLDIGAGANGIYCILGVQHFNWSMIGAESDAVAVKTVSENMLLTNALKDKIEIRHQENKSFLFNNIIQPKEQFDFSVCNPPFHSSKDEALKGSLKKQSNLVNPSDRNTHLLNFEGQANELWCNGGEALFIKRLIKESLGFKSQVKVFSCLVSKADSLAAIEKQLKKAKANHQIIPMDLGNKKSRIMVWWFDSSL